MKFVEAAYRVLKDAGGPLRAEAIVKRARAEGWIETKGKTPEHTMRVTITQEINSRGEDARFDHADPMTFKLRDAGAKPRREPGNGPQRPRRGSPQGTAGAKPRREPGNGPAAEEPKDEETDDDKRRYDFTGVAGEHWVQSKLLFHNYETSRPVPDMGVDLVARKDGNSFYLQVKTANKKGNAYYFPLREKAFKRLRDVGAYHVFVMRNPSGDVRCLVLSRNTMKEMIKAEKISLVKMGKSHKGYQVRITENGGAYGIKGDDVSKYVDNWDL